MDLITVTNVRVARSRTDLALTSGETVLAGGSWLFSEPQPHISGLVDITTLGWEPITITDDTLSIAATCTIAQLAALESAADWAAHPLIRECCESLLGSFKIWNVATVGGNICLALAAAPMSALTVALDAIAVVWAAHDSERRIAMADFVLGAQQTALEPGEVLRSIEIPLSSLRDRVGFRRIALSPLGRTGAMVIARQSRGGVVFTVAGATLRPHLLRFENPPTAPELTSAVLALDDWFDDAHGTIEWRRAMSLRFALQLREELA